MIVVGAYTHYRFSCSALSAANPGPHNSEPNMSSVRTGRVLRDVSAAKPIPAQPTPDEMFEGVGFRSDFQPCGVTLLVKGRDPLVTYVGEYKGKFNRHIRTIYQDANGVWCPGKGVSFPADQTNAVIATLTKECTHD